MSGTPPSVSLCKSIWQLIYRSVDLFIEISNYHSNYMHACVSLCVCAGEMDSAAKESRAMRRGCPCGGRGREGCAHHRRPREGPRRAIFARCGLTSTVALERADRPVPGAHPFGGIAGMTSRLRRHPGARGGGVGVIRARARRGVDGVAFPVGSTREKRKKREPCGPRSLQRIVGPPRLSVGTGERLGAARVPERAFRLCVGHACACSRRVPGVAMCGAPIDDEVVHSNGQTFGKSVVRMLRVLAIEISARGSAPGAFYGGPNAWVGNTAPKSEGGGARKYGRIRPPRAQNLRMLGAERAFQCRGNGFRVSDRIPPPALPVGRIRCPPPPPHFEPTSAPEKQRNGASCAGFV